MSVIYEVNVTVDKTIRREYLEWLEGHIAEILSISGFLAATLLEDSKNPERLTVAYELGDEESLNNYLKEHAPRLRQDAVNRFGERFKADRRVLWVKRRFGKTH